MDYYLRYGCNRTNKFQITKIADFIPAGSFTFYRISFTKSDAGTEEKLWTDFSLTQAMRGLEDDDAPEYTKADLKEKWR